MKLAICAGVGGAAVAVMTMLLMSHSHKEYVDNELKARYSTGVTKKQ